MRTGKGFTVIIDGQMMTTGDRNDMMTLALALMSAINQSYPDRALNLLGQLPQRP